MVPVREMLDAQRGQVLLWMPVFLGTGIGVYFSLKTEPSAVVLAGCAALMAINLLLAVLRRYGLAYLLLPLSLIAAGLLLATWRANDVAAPVLDWRYYGAVQGRVVMIDRSQSDVPRLTLDNVVLNDVAPHKTPTRVRVSLHGDQQYLTPEPGLTVMMTAHLSPPGGPVEPGGFDFQRMAWFQGLGAVGYTRTPALVLYPADPNAWDLVIYRLRMQISQGIQARIPGETGAFASAILTGDRSGIGQEALEDLRASNLAHLLAISGLHMGLLTGFVFAAVRMGIALIPPLAMRVSGKKIAAVVALIAATLYLGLSGGAVATQRAYIMVAVMLVAILFNRRALTLRGVALAAIIVLVLRPEALMGPGFQMSFAATTALVAVFSALRGWDYRLPRVIRPVFSVLASSAVAGAATAPFAAAHFNQVAHFGLLANLLSVPLMGSVVIPSAVLAAILSPFGLEWIPLWVMGVGIDWILFVAGWVASLDGALSRVPSPPDAVLPLLTFGAIFVILFRGLPRWIGVLPVIAAFALWGNVERPALLISESGGLIGVMTDQGRVLSKARGEGFVASNWLENDGDLVTQEDAAARGQIEQINLAQQVVLHRTGKAARTLPADCDGADWVIVNAKVEQPVDCTIIGPDSLKQSGAIAIYNPQAPRIVMARQTTGLRLWNKRQYDQPPPDLRTLTKAD
nr:ComEC/Rec2 family competence protein [Pseudaestuariivita rosea]